MTDLALGAANASVAAALAAARKAGRRAMAAVVVDDAGNLESAPRQDGASRRAAGRAPE